MNVSLCTISFRHQLQSLNNLAQWANDHQFQGIELWGVHAKNLLAEAPTNIDMLESYGLPITMVSDYVPLMGTTEQLMDSVQLLSLTAKAWKTKKVRIFAGNKSSLDMTETEKQILVQRLRDITDYFYKNNQLLLIETHPNTFADRLESIIRLVKEVAHPGLRLNFDVLHIWEAGVDPLEAFSLLKNHISHFHFKNITSREQLHVFQQDNVYSPAGTREGMVPLFEGAIQYEPIIEKILNSHSDIDASLEWFGPNVQEVLKKDRMKLKELERASQYV
ncbi:sugar phosphate isomerase/epimerase family protein [Alkalihalobacillus sp. 1P02AB]|uniref:sugar phosphate isomerase/epimerase family protein n=1 Tax=Alkalihalobacillus sp. 1P02AB TaxID=3132260 RepID=UPI0039A452CB